MAMLCWPLDNTEYEAKGVGLEHATRTRGVFSADDNLKVSPGGGMAVSVAEGVCYLKWAKYWGVSCLLEPAERLELDIGDGALTRKDAIVVQLDKAENVARVAVKKGTPASAPVAPAPVRDDDFDEITLAIVTVPAGTVDVSAAMISDTRLDEAVCGLMVDTAANVPTSALYEQWDSFYSTVTAATVEKQQQLLTQFEEWFANVQNQLSEDVAGKLQTEVEAATSHRFTVKAEAAKWQEQDDGSYQQSFTVEGVTEKTTIDAIHAEPGDAETLDDKQAIVNAVGQINAAVTGDGTITLVCYSGAPEISVNLILLEVK